MKKILNWVFPKFSLSEKVLLLLVLSYILASCWLAYTNGVLDKLKFFLYFTTAKSTIVILFFALILYACFKVLWWKLVKTPTPLFNEWWPILRQSILNKKRIISAIPMFFILVLFLSMMSNMKGLIGYYGVYSWDPRLAELDRQIHFNTDPWRLLQPLLGYPLITAFINQLYNLWFGFLIFFLYWQLFADRSSRLRIQFYYTFVIVWAINGTLLAIIFASGGPCYYQAMTGQNYFNELMSYLNEVDKIYPISALEAQRLLFQLYKQDKISIGVGISAMPSMHVATSYLFYLLTSNINKWAGYFFGLYCLAILIGSVHLAWHYAIDGYLSIITTLMYWKLSGLLIRWFEK